MIDTESFRTERTGLELIYDVIVWQNATILRWTILTTSLALVWLLLQPARYTATTQLLLDTKRYQPVMDAQANATIDSSYVETQLSTLKSDTIASAVLDSLRLWEDPEFTGGRGLLTRITALFATSALETPRQVVLDNFKRQLSVRQSGRSYIADVSYTSLNSNRAAAIANEFTKAYIDDLFRFKAANAERANAWLLDTGGMLLDKASKAEQRVEDFRAADLQTSPGRLTNFDALKESRVRLRALEAHAQAYRRVYEGFLSRTGEALPQQTFPVTEARVIGPALPPLHPSSSRSIALLLAAVTGASIGFLSGFTKEQLTSKVRSPGALEQIGLKSVGNIPLIRGRLLLPESLKIGPLYLGADTEALHRVKLMIDDAFPRNSGCVIGVVSAHTGEGKTTIAFNLAILLAKRESAALIDLNLRSPILTEASPPPKECHQPSNAKSVVPGNFYKHEMGFAFMRAPDTNHDAHPTAALLSPCTREALQTAREMFRYTIVDLPSAEHVDACVVAPQIDAFILVVETDRNGAEELRRSVSSTNIGHRIIGTIINKT
jgi:succinoglycan biosynthesis transport protein ExoP